MSGRHRLETASHMEYQTDYGPVEPVQVSITLHNQIDGILLKEYKAAMVPFPYAVAIKYSSMDPIDLHTTGRVYPR